MAKIEFINFLNCLLRHFLQPYETVSFITIFCMCCKILHNLCFAHNFLPLLKFYLGCTLSILARYLCPSFLMYITTFIQLNEFCHSIYLHSPYNAVNIWIQNYWITILVYKINVFKNIMKTYWQNVLQYRKHNNIC